MGKRIGVLDGVFEAHGFLGSKRCIDLSYRTEGDLERRLALLSEFTGDSKPTPFHQRHVPTVNKRLSLLDWQILKTLRHDALAPLSKVAARLKVSLKSLKLKQRGKNA